MTIIRIPIPKAPIARTEAGEDLEATREWYKFWTALVEAVGGGTTTIGDSSLAVAFFNEHSLGVSQRIDGLEKLLPAALLRSFTSFASTTEQLTGTATGKASTPDSVAALWEQGSNIASAATISVGEGGYFHVTGTTTITDIDFVTDKNGRGAWLVFDGVLMLTHNASTLILPGSANILTAAGDCCYLVSEGSDVVRVLVYVRKTAVIPAGTGIYAPLTTGVLSGGTDPEFVVTAAGEVIMAELV